MASARLRRIERADQQGAALGRADRRRVGAGHAQDDVGVGEHRRAIAQGRAGRFIVGIGNRRAFAGAAFDRDLGAQREIFADGFGNSRDARFGAAFLEDRDLHPARRLSWR